MISKWVTILFLEVYIGISRDINRGYIAGNGNGNVANNNASSNNIVNPEIINNRLIWNVQYISCSCGKRCKGLRGLKWYQRSRRVIKSTSDNIVDNLEDDYNELNDNNNFDINNDSNLSDDTTNESPSLKNAVKLPVSTNDWDIANAYFHFNLPVS